MSDLRRIARGIFEVGKCYSNSRNTMMATEILAHKDWIQFNNSLWLEKERERINNETAFNTKEEDLYAGDLLDQVSNKTNNSSNTSSQSLSSMNTPLNRPSVSSTDNVSSNLLLQTDNTFSQDRSSPQFDPMNDPHTAHNGSIEFSARQGRAIPSTPISRIAHLSSLFGGLAAGAAAETVRQITRGEAPDIKKALWSPQNSKRMGKSLCKLRGAALKLGQFLSMQEDKLPEPLRDALASARASADPMPQDQLLSTLQQELGADWRDKFAEFDEHPIAAASIGQVHRARLHDGMYVAVKVQYPGVADAIDADLSNLMALATYTRVLPSTLYADILAREMGAELKAECDYENEKNYYKAFHAMFSAGDKVKNTGVYIPSVIDHLSTSKVLTVEWVSGSTLAETARECSSEERDSVGRRLLWLSLRELFVFKVMQTDPNPGNFFYHRESDNLCLIDFGAGRKFRTEFVDSYLRVVQASADGDWDAAYFFSRELGFLTGEESNAMVDAHLRSLISVGEPFRPLKSAADLVRQGEMSSAEALMLPFDFTITDMVDDVKDTGPTMLRERKCPPPPEVYSLHRKLAGCFLLNMSLKAKVPCRKMLKDVITKYQFSKENDFIVQGRPRAPVPPPPQLVEYLKRVRLDSKVLPLQNNL